MLSVKTQRGQQRCAALPQPLCINTGMKSILSAARTAFDLLGNPKTKNVLLLVLALASAFGVLAPETATALRDAVTGLVF